MTQVLLFCNLFNRCYFWKSRFDVDLEVGTDYRITIFCANKADYRITIFWSLEMHQMKGTWQPGSLSSWIFTWVITFYWLIGSLRLDFSERSVLKCMAVFDLKNGRKMVSFSEKCEIMCNRYVSD